MNKLVVLWVVNCSNIGLMLAATGEGRLLALIRSLNDGCLMCRCVGSSIEEIKRLPFALGKEKESLARRIARLCSVDGASCVFVLTGSER